MDVDQLRAALLDRDIDLNEGLPPTFEFEVGLLARLPRDLPTVHRAFDGFNGMCTRTYFEMFSVRTIQKMVCDASFGCPEGYIILGDFLIWSDFIVCDYRDPLYPMRLLHGNEVLSESYRSFWNALLKGHSTIASVAFASASAGHHESGASRSLSDA